MQTRRVRRFEPCLWAERDPVAPLVVDASALDMFPPTISTTARYSFSMSAGVGSPSGNERTALGHSQGPRWSQGQHCRRADVSQPPSFPGPEFEIDQPDHFTRLRQASRWIARRRTATWSMRCTIIAGPDGLIARAAEYGQSGLPGKAPVRDGNIRSNQYCPLRPPLPHQDPTIAVSRISTSSGPQRRTLPLPSGIRLSCIQ